MSYSGFFLACSVVLSLMIQCQGYPSGAPDTACSSMIPAHGKNPQTSSAPYTITVSKNTYSPSDTITVTITSTDNTRPIRGFLLQARRADPSTDQTTAIGTFSVPDAKSKTACSGNALTHTDANTNTIQTLVTTWTAPNTAQGHIEFKVSVAQNHDIFWVNIKSSIVQDPTAPAITPVTASTNAPTSTPISVTECDKSKGCIRTPNTCTSSCDAIVTWKDLGNGNVQMELGRKGTGWVGLGLSNDQAMGDDSVISCIRYNNDIVVSQSMNVGRSNQQITSPEDGISNVEVGYINGDVVCRFQRKKQVSGRTDKIYDLNNNYYFLLGSGSTISANSQGKVQHSTTPLISGAKVDIASTASVNAGSLVAPAVKAHGSIMVFSWVITASFGVLMARHYKKQWPGKQACGKDIWFMLHVPSMFATAILTLIAFIIIFVHAKGYSNLSTAEPSILRAHPVLGIIVTVLALLNPIMGILRPHPNTKRRPLFDWAHWGVGTGARILATITIFLGLNLPSIKAALGESITWVMVAFVAFYILVEIILEVYKCVANSKSGSSSMEMKSPGEQGSSSVDQSHEKGQLFRNIMFVLIIVGLLSLGLAIIILIAKP